MAIEKAYGATLVGKYHRRKNQFNQDYYLVHNCDSYSLACVADGLGSKKHSRVASRRICKIIKREIQRRFANDNFDVYETITKIQEKFKKNLFPFNLKNCDTTCSFVVVSALNILSVKIGDGLLAIKGEDTTVLKAKEGDFVNETITIGKAQKKDWLIKMIEKNPNVKYKILICTDGISEDLIIEELPIFIEELTNTITGRNKNNKMLKTILKNWPNKYSNDDKTIVVVK